MFASVAAGRAWTAGRPLGMAGYRHLGVFGPTVQDAAAARAGTVHVRWPCNAQHAASAVTVERVDIELEALNDAIAELYRTFESYPLRPWTEPCMHCHTAEEERLIRSAPLRELQPADLAGFAADSLMTWGEVVDLKHFLPRLFEIVAKEQFPDDYPDLETVIGALDRGEWRNWPASEQLAVDEALMALWRRHLTSSPANYDTDTVVAAISTAVDDMGPYLDAWEAMPGSAPTIRLAEFAVANYMQAALAQHLSNPWLRDRADQELQVRKWLLRSVPASVSRLEAAFLDASDEQTLEVLASALDIARRPT